MTAVSIESGIFKIELRQRKLRTIATTRPSHPGRACRTVKPSLQQTSLQTCGTSSDNCIGKQEKLFPVLEFSKSIFRQFYSKLWTDMFHPKMQNSSKKLGYCFPCRSLVTKEELKDLFLPS